MLKFNTLVDEEPPVEGSASCTEAGAGIPSAIPATQTTTKISLRTINSLLIKWN